MWSGWPQPKYFCCKQDKNNNNNHFQWEIERFFGISMSNEIKSNPTNYKEYFQFDSSIFCELVFKSLEFILLRVAVFFFMHIIGVDIFSITLCVWTSFELNQYSLLCIEIVLVLMNGSCLYRQIRVQSIDGLTNIDIKSILRKLRLQRCFQAPGYHAFELPCHACSQYLCYRAPYQVNRP